MDHPWDEHYQPAISSCFKGGGYHNPTPAASTHGANDGVSPVARDRQILLGSLSAYPQMTCKKTQKNSQMKSTMSQWVCSSFPVTISDFGNSTSQWLQLLGTWLLLDCHVAGIGTPLEPHSYDLQPERPAPTSKRAAEKWCPQPTAGGYYPSTLWSLCWLMKLIISSWGWNMVKIDIVYAFFPYRLVFGFQKSWISLSGWRNHHRTTERQRPKLSISWSELPWKLPEVVRLGREPLITTGFVGPVLPSCLNLVMLLQTGRGFFMPMASWYCSLSQMGGGSKAQLQPILRITGVVTFANGWWATNTWIFPTTEMVLHHSGYGGMPRYDPQKTSYFLFLSHICTMSKTLYVVYGCLQSSIPFHGKQNTYKLV